MRMQEQLLQKNIVFTKEGALATAYLPWLAKAVTSAPNLKIKEPD